MEANELMIGDWVMDGDMPTRVTSITCDGIVETTRRISNIEVVDPIPLTPEILKKNGFEKRISDYWVLEVMGEREYNVVAWKQIFLQIQFTNGDLSWTNCRYVHELQHALRLCGIDKEIVL